MAGGALLDAALEDDHVAAFLAMEVHPEKTVASSHPSAPSRESSSWNLPRSSSSLWRPIKPWVITVVVYSQVVIPRSLPCLRAAPAKRATALREKEQLGTAWSHAESSPARQRRYEWRCANAATVPIASTAVDRANPVRMSPNWSATNPVTVGPRH